MTIGLRFDDRIPPDGHSEFGGVGGDTATAGGWKRMHDRELDNLAVPLLPRRLATFDLGRNRGRRRLRAHDRSHRALGARRPGCRGTSPGSMTVGAARRVPRGGRRALGFGRHPRRPEPPARPLRRGAPGNRVASLSYLRGRSQTHLKWLNLGSVVMAWMAGESGTIPAATRRRTNSRQSGCCGEERVELGAAPRVAEHREHARAPEADLGVVGSEPRTRLVIAGITPSKSPALRERPAHPRARL